MIKALTPNLMVEDVEATVAFYCGALGFAKVDSVTGPNGKLQFAILAADNHVLMFQQRENLMAEYPSLQTEVVKPSISLFLQVDNYNEWYEKLKDKVQIAAAHHITFYGMNEFAVFDNNGYVLTIAEKNG